MIEMLRDFQLLAGHPCSLLSALSLWCGWKKLIRIDGAYYMHIDM